MERRQEVLRRYRGPLIHLFRKNVRHWFRSLPIKDESAKCFQTKTTSYLTNTQLAQILLDYVIKEELFYPVVDQLVQIGEMRLAIQMLKKYSMINIV